MSMLSKKQREDIAFTVMDLFESFLDQEDLKTNKEKLEWFEARLKKELYLD